MNKYIALIGALLCATLFGAADDMVLSFSTPGVDRYADGRRVKDGESYALVWTAEGAEFKGLTSACEPVAETDRIVMVAPLAKGGKCPVTVLEIEGAAIRLEVKGMSEAADYFVVPGDTPGNFASAMDAKADAEGFTFEKPETPAAFYKVIGVRKF